MQPGGQNQRQLLIVLLQRFYRWLFFIEGGFTCVIAMLAFYVIPDFPTTRASWLTAEEQLLAQERILQDRRGITVDPLKSSTGLVEALTDLTVWWLAIPMMFMNTSQSFLAFFPTIAATIGYGPSVTLLLCIPPQLVTIIASFLISGFVLCFVFVLTISAFFIATQTGQENVSGTLLVPYSLLSLVFPSQLRR